MKWLTDGHAAHTSHADDCDGKRHLPECGRFTISRAPAPGFAAPRGITYMLTERGSPPRILHVERGVLDTHDDTLAATKKCKAMAGAQA